MTIKDSIDTEGVISAGGTLGRLQFVPTKDVSVVARLRAAGAILLGKTNTPEYTLARGGVVGISTTANLIHGVTRNPYDLTRSTAGGSGGAGAIVAAGGAAFDVGSDWAEAFAARRTTTGLPGSSPPWAACHARATSSISAELRFLAAARTDGAPRRGPDPHHAAHHRTGLP
jgi:amidase